MTREEFKKLEAAELDKIAKACPNYQDSDSQDAESTGDSSNGARGPFDDKCNDQPRLYIGTGAFRRENGIF